MQNVVYKKGPGASLNFQVDERFIPFLQREIQSNRTPIQLPSRFGPVSVKPVGQGWYTATGLDSEGRDVEGVRKFLLALLHRWNRETNTLNRMEAMLAAGDLVIGEGPEEEPLETEVMIPTQPAAVHPGTLHVDPKVLAANRRRKHVAPSDDQLSKLKARFR